MHRSIKAAQRRVKRANLYLADAISRVRIACQHESVAEAPFTVHGTFFKSQSPARRICECCGLEERGGCGFDKLRDRHGRSVRQVTHDELYRMRP